MNTLWLKMRIMGCGMGQLYMSVLKHPDLIVTSTIVGLLLFAPDFKFKEADEVETVRLRKSKVWREEQQSDESVRYYQIGTLQTLQ